MFFRIRRSIFDYFHFNSHLTVNGLKDQLVAITKMVSPHFMFCNGLLCSVSHVVPCNMYFVLTTHTLYWCSYGRRSGCDLEIWTVRILCVFHSFTALTLVGRLWSGLSLFYYCYYCYCTCTLISFSFIAISIAKHASRKYKRSMQSASAQCIHVLLPTSDFMFYAYEYNVLKFNRTIVHAIQDHVNIFVSFCDFCVCLFGGTTKSTLTNTSNFTK